MIPRVPVESTVLRSIGYEADSLTLAVEFTSSGEVYYYTGVPSVLYDAIMVAPSKGVFFHRAVRGKFPATKMPDPRTGTCPQCGDLGLEGCTCDDCGCGIYTVQPFTEGA